MSQDATAAAQPVEHATIRRAVAASALGNATEWFDYGIYAYGVTRQGVADFVNGPLSFPCN